MKRKITNEELMLIKYALINMLHLMELRYGDEADSVNEYRKLLHKVYKLADIRNKTANQT